MSRIKWRMSAATFGLPGRIRFLSRMTGGNAICGIRMEYARLREPAVSQSESTGPGDRAFLAAAAKCSPPLPDEPSPEYAETVEVPRYRMVVEVSLHNRLEPLAGLAYGIVHTRTELLLASAGRRRSLALIVLRKTKRAGVVLALVGPKLASS